MMARAPAVSLLVRAAKAWAASRARPRPCPQTIREERLLCRLAYGNGLFSLLFPGGYVSGWRYAGLILPQQGYGLLTLALALYADFAIHRGKLSNRVAVSVLGMILAGVVGTFIFLANPLALPVPMFAVIVVSRAVVLWEMGEQAGREGVAPP